MATDQLCFLWEMQNVSGDIKANFYLHSVSISAAWEAETLLEH